MATKNDFYTLPKGYESDKRLVRPKSVDFNITREQLLYYNGYSIHSTARHYNGGTDMYASHEFLVWKIKQGNLRIAMIIKTEDAQPSTAIMCTCRIVVSTTSDDLTFNSESLLPNNANIIKFSIYTIENTQLYALNYEKSIGFLMRGFRIPELTQIRSSGVTIDLDSIQTNLDKKYGIGVYNLDVVTSSPTFGDASIGGGYSTPSFDNSSDTIGIPPQPQVGVTNVGFVNVYRTGLNSLQNLGEELFPDFAPFIPQQPSADVPTAIVEGFNNLVQNVTNLLDSYINNSLINFIIDCHILPCSPAVSASQNIKIGFKTFSSSGDRVTSDYVDIECGTLNIGEYYTNFIDYVGTRAQLFLPFVGFVDIKNEYFQDGFLTVTYRFNIIDGSFIAFVKSSSSKSNLSDSVIGTYSGNCCVHLPITGLNYASMVSGVIGGVTSIAMGGATGALTGAIGVMSAKPTMQSSNAYNATSGFLGIRKPFLIIEREVSNFSENYTNENGLPCNITKKLSEISGFTTLENIHLDGLTCTDAERSELQALFDNGIIL